MCCGYSKPDVARVNVLRHEDVVDWRPVRQVIRTERSFRDFQLLTYKWFENVIYDGKKITIPEPIFKLLFKQTFDHTFTLIEFAAVLYFFHINSVDVYLHRYWWRLFFETPVFRSDMTCDDAHPYIFLFNLFKDIPIRAIADIGALYNVRDNTFRYKKLKPWNIYNVWKCSGYTSFLRGGFMRWVDTSISHVDSEGNSLDWNHFGAVDPTTRLAVPELFELRIVTVPTPLPIIKSE